MVNCAACNATIEVLQRSFISHAIHEMKHCCDEVCRRQYTSQLLTGRVGHPFTETMRQHQLETMLSRYGVSNAYMLAERSVISKPQRAVFEFISSEFPECAFQLEVPVTAFDKTWYADILSSDLKIIIEFNGDYWHCNPTIYVESYHHPVKQCSAREVWLADQKRLNSLTDAGYSVYTIWESDFKSETQSWKEDLKRWISDRKNKSTASV